MTTDRDLVLLLFSCLPRYEAESVGGGMSRLEVEQLVVGKHSKIHADGVKLDVHAFKDSVGVWLSGNEVGVDTIGVFMRKGESPYFMLYPPAGFCDGRNSQVPFAFGGNGLQIPQLDGGQPVVIPLTELAKWALRWKAANT